MRLVTATALLTAGVVNAATLDLNYLTGDKDILRTQVQAVNDKTRIYSEVNVVGVGQSESYLTSRTILRYQLPLVHLHAQGTYAPSYKEHFIGVGVDLLGVNANAGVNEDGDATALIAYGYKFDEYRLTTNGHVDLNQDTYKGRFDLMYKLGAFKVGYEAQFKETDITNWIKAGVRF